MFYFVFFLFFIILTISYTIKSYVIKQNLFRFEIFILIFLVAFRWEIGTDWEAYYQYFTSSKYIDNEIFEIGYVYLNNIVRSFTSNYTIFLLIFSSFFFLVLYKTINKYSIYPLLSIFVFFFSYITSIGTNRQLLALAICLLALPFIFRRNLAYFLISIGIACCFHMSAIIFSITYLFTYHLNFKKILILIAVVVVIKVINIIAIIENYVPFLGALAEYKLNAAIKSANENSITNIILGLVRNLIWIILAIYSYPNVKNKIIYNYFLNFSIFGVIIYFIFNNTILQLFVARLALYFNMGLVFIIPYTFLLFKGKNKLIVLFILFLFGYIIMDKNMDSILSTAGQDFFRPYKSIFF